jgi:hypothetical protein
MDNQCSGSEFDMHVFSDADWAGDSSTQRSAGCYTMRYLQAGDQSIGTLWRNARTSMASGGDERVGTMNRRTHTILPQ